MASSGGSAWTRDPQRQDYYYVSQDTYGNYTYHYQSQSSANYAPSSTTAGGLQSTTGYGCNQPSASQSATGYGYNQPIASQYTASYGHNQPTTSYDVSDPWSSSCRPRVDSGTGATGPVMPERAPSEVRAGLPHLIEGTPETGWYERLDSTYRMRTGAEIYQFFKVGKVFSMLHIQAASENLIRQYDNSDVTIVRYGEHAFSQIRRFVVVEARRGFVYACPITTYSGRGCLKYGCIPSEHSAVYIRGETPMLFEGEYERGLTKSSICIVPVDASIHMTPGSRLHYAKTYPVEMNVKVKDIGDVASEDLSDLLRYYQEENALVSTSATSPYDRSSELSSMGF